MHLTLIFWRDRWPGIKQQSTVNLWYGKATNKVQCHCGVTEYGGIWRFHSWANLEGRAGRHLTRKEQKRAETESRFFRPERPYEVMSIRPLAAALTSAHAKSFCRYLAKNLPTTVTVGNSWHYSSESPDPSEIIEGTIIKCEPGGNLTARNGGGNYSFRETWSH